ncbi:MAG: type II toxin-antitoxin system Phd/YefM family antitoxin [Anaerolineae bacterium]|nr:type II toxin-antitoxin system Phd/YefM family antitoxin [Anaerolineae bacterium]
MATLSVIPKMVGVSELRLRQKEILEQLEDSPIVLAHRNQALAVLVPVDLWNSLLEELSDLRDAQIAAERLAEAQSDPSALRSLEDVQADLTEAGLLDD